MGTITSKAPKLESLEGLRGQMALWVFATHFVTLAGYQFSKASGLGFLIANGEHAVNVFVLLSGFVIALLFAKKHESYLPFITRRAFRLFPAYLVALALSVATVNIALRSLEETPWPVDKTEGRIAMLRDSLENKTTHLLLHIPLLHGVVPEKFVPNTSYAFMGQAWSLSLEWQYYLIAPALAALCYRKARKSTLLVLGIFAVLFLFHRTSQQSFILNKLHLFVGGMISYMIYSIQTSNPEKKDSAIAWLLLLGIAIASVDFRNTSIAMAIWVLALYGEMKVTKSSHAINRILSSGPFKSLGQCSYSFYCLHMVALYLTSYFLIEIIEISSHWQYAAWLLVIGLSTSIIASIISYRYIESPFISLGKKVADGIDRKQPTAAAPSVA